MLYFDLNTTIEKKSDNLKKEGHYWQSEEDE